MSHPGQHGRNGRTLYFSNRPIKSERWITLFTFNPANARNFVIENTVLVG
jgi:hypothetical protein